MPEVGLLGSRMELKDVRDCPPGIRAGGTTDCCTGPRASPGPPVSMLGRGLDGKNLFLLASPSLAPRLNAAAEIVRGPPTTEGLDVFDTDGAGKG